MPTVRVTIRLPYLLVLPTGEYPMPGEAGSVFLAEASIACPDGTSETKTAASTTFDATEGLNPASQDRQRGAEANRLLRRVNHLLRWYRATTAQPSIIELTRAKASPFRFTVEGSSAAWGDPSPLEYEAPTLRLPTGGSRAAFGDAVRRGLAGKTDPDVATLNLLDADTAMSVGRFREAVLLCWSAIDSTFVRKFESLVDARLGDDWSEGRDFLKGIDFGLRQKMSVGLHLLAERSLFNEPGGFWQELSTSYSLRNDIIHRGQVANEDQAKMAIRVAMRIVLIVASLPMQ